MALQVLMTRNKNEPIYSYFDGYVCPGTWHEDDCPDAHAAQALQNLYTYYVDCEIEGASKKQLGFLRSIIEDQMEVVLISKYDLVAIRIRQELQASDRGEL